MFKAHTMSKSSSGEEDVLILILVSKSRNPKFFLSYYPLLKCNTFSSCQSINELERVF